MARSTRKAKTYGSQGRAKKKGRYGKGGKA